MMAHDHHGHGHDHDHGHHHAPASFGAAFAVGTTLNAAFVAAQIFFGVVAHSMALLADAVHNAGDVLGLLAAWGAATLAMRGPTTARTYGWGRTTILAALANAVLMLVSCGAIALEAIRRVGAPERVAGATVMWVAALGIAINGATALMFMRGRHDDLNVRGAFLHMVADTAVSAGVVITGLLITLTRWNWLDPASSLAIVAVIVIGTWGLLRDAANLAMDAVPLGIDLAEVEAALRALPGVAAVHDLHVWGLSTTTTALTVHLVQASGDGTALIRAAEHEVRTRFRIGHATFQVETPELARTCSLAPADVI
ncbi:MAG: cation transporter [Rhodospirillales bacterium]|nr:cation transporter [Rhodospirillales bacterium]